MSYTYIYYTCIYICTKHCEKRSDICTWIILPTHPTYINTTYIYTCTCILTSIHSVYTCSIHACVIYKPLFWVVGGMWLLRSPLTADLPGSRWSEERAEICYSGKTTISFFQLLTIFVCSLLTSIHAHTHTHTHHKTQLSKNLVSACEVETHNKV